MSTKYIHTLNGRPAAFYGGQICYAAFYGKANLFCCSLSEIKHQRELTKKLRLARGFDFKENEYKHLRFGEPHQEKEETK